MAESAYALLVRLEAAPEKTDELAAFLESALPMAEDESGTNTWFALREDTTTFIIYDTFPTEEARQSHLDGDVASALMAKADELLASEPDIQELDILAGTH